MLLQAIAVRVSRSCSLAAPERGRSVRISGPPRGGDGRRLTRGLPVWRWLGHQGASAQVYKRKDPAGVDEVELLENLFDCLCSTLLEGDNRPRFLKAEGVELMIILIKSVWLAPDRPAIVSPSSGDQLT